MCGIAGILDPRGVEESDVRRMADVLAHRGPDEASVHVEPSLGFGFRRLSIIDLEGGSQPIANEDGSVSVILNGEIYNYRALREELRERGHRFSTDADTEVLPHLYEEHGVDLVQRIRGMFGFALWDRNRRRLLIGRDHLGQKPVYWARKGGRLWFASEIKAILAVAPQFRKLNPKALHEYLTLRIISEPRSMFEGVQQMPGGHLMVAEPGAAPETKRYWNLAFEPKMSLSEGDALDRLDRELRETVRFHLVADVEVGTFLSGGIDSGLITAMAAEEMGGHLQTFSMGTPYQNFDERPAARAVAERYGTDHHEWAARADVLELLPEVVQKMDEPSDPLSVCVYALAQKASEHVKVVLGGDGGDELFGGYDRYYGAQYVRYWAMLPEVVREEVIGRLLNWAPGGDWYKSIVHQLRWLNELASVSPSRRYPRSLSYFYFTPKYRHRLYTGEFERRVDSYDPEEAVAFWMSEDRARESLDRMLLADAMVRLPNHPVMILDRTTMAHGLEARSPFLDHELAEYCARLPARLKVRGRKRRWIQMKLAERYLPDEVLNRPKQGFSSAMPYMAADELHDIFHAFLHDGRLIDDGLLRQQGVSDLLREHTNGVMDHGNRLWLLLNAELWYRAHILGESATIRWERSLADGGAHSSSRGT